jgi:hypothetical protein
VAGRWFSPDTSVSSNNNTADCHDLTEILLVALNTINWPCPINIVIFFSGPIGLPRACMEDVTISGKVIPKHSVIIPHFMSAHYDEAT